MSVVNNNEAEERVGRRYSWKASLISPMLASVVTNLVLQPLDLVKMKMQMDSLAARSLFQTTADILRSGGILSFYKGSAINFVGGALIASYRWGIYKDLTTRKRETDSWMHGWFGKVFLTSLVIGGSLSFLTSPVDHARIKVNTPQFAGMYSGSFDAVGKIYRSAGLRGLYRGFNFTFTRDVLFYVVFLSLFDRLTSFFSERGWGSLSISWSSVIVSQLAWIASYPTDTLKTILQSDCLKAPKWTTASYLRFIWKRGRIFSLYNGISSVLLRSAPSNFIFFSVWDFSFRKIDQYESSKLKA